MTRRLHWMGERDYARDLAMEERERRLDDEECVEERRDEPQPLFQDDIGREW